MSNKPWAIARGVEEIEEVLSKTTSHHHQLPDLIIAPRDMIINILLSANMTVSQRLARSILRAAWTKGPRMVATELSLAYDADVTPKEIAEAIAYSYSPLHEPRHSLPFDTAILSSNYKPRHLQPS